MNHDSAAHPRQAPAEPLHIDGRDLATEGRFHRFGLISWWDQKKLSAARVLVIGAGALGNEIVKNLALLGVGNVFIADMDHVENSNLSRSVLFRESDNGRPKAQVAARMAREIYPQMRVAAFHGNVVYDLGVGVYRWADVVIGGLDNREARLAINRACYRVNRPWIDGAIEQIQGTARMFVPDGPCYECTMSQLDWKLLQMRRSCNLLTRTQMIEGRTPTTPTVSSMVAGLQCQEAVKLLHGLPTMAGKGWVFDGLSAEAYTIEFQRKADCYSHDALNEIVPLECGVAQITLRELLQTAKKLAGADAQVELCRDVLSALTCPNCRRREEVFSSLGRATADMASCPHCPGVQREVETFFRIRGDEAFLDRSAAEIGLPAMDMVIARSPQRNIGLEMHGDGPAVLGALYEGEALEWE